MTQDKVGRSHDRAPPALPVPLFLDSSCFRRETGWDDGAFSRLKELVKARAVDVYVHELALREVSTGLVDDLPTPSAIKAIRRTLSWLDDDARRDAAAAIETFERLRAMAHSSLGQYMETRLVGMGANIIRLDPHQGVEMWRRYFTGEPPFASKKSRNDIPDAALFVAALELQDKLARTLHVVSADERLSRAFSALGSHFVCHARLGAFNTHPEVASIMLALSAARGEAVAQDEFKRWEGLVRSCISSARRDIESLLNDALLEKLPGEDIVSSSFPSDDNKASIEMVGEVDALELELDDLEELSRDSVLVPFVATVDDITATLYIHRSEAYGLDDDEAPEAIRISITDWEWNEKFVRADAELSIRVRGTLAIDLEWDDYETCRFVSAAVEDIEEITAESDTQ